MCTNQFTRALRNNCNCHRRSIFRVCFYSESLVLYSTGTLTYHWLTRFFIIFFLHLQNWLQHCLLFHLTRLSSHSFCSSSLSLFFGYFSYFLFYCLALLFSWLVQFDVPFFQHNWNRRKKKKRNKFQLKITCLCWDDLNTHAPHAQSPNVCANACVRREERRRKKVREREKKTKEKKTIKNRIIYTEISICWNLCT